MTFEPTPAPALDAEAIDHALADLRARREREESEARARGGPCRYCGTQESWVVPPPQLADRRLRSSEPRPARRGEAGAVGRWYEPSICSLCWVDRHQADGDDDHRATVLYRLLPEARGRWLPGFMLERFRLRWWEEIPGAEPGGTTRFAHVDLDAARAALFPPPTGPEYETLGPCGRCGVADRWVQEPLYRRASATVELGSVERYVARRTEEQHTYLRPTGETRPRCGACSHAPEDLDEFVCRVVGLRRGAEYLLHDPTGTKLIAVPLTEVHLWSVAALLGVCWYRQLGRTDPQPHAFAWWPPVDELRAVAFERYPDERYWLDRRAWERARQAAATVAA